MLAVYHLALSRVSRFLFENEVYRDRLVTFNLLCRKGLHL